MRLKNTKLKYDYFLKFVLGHYLSYLFFRRTVTEIYLKNYNLDFVLRFLKNNSLYSVKMLTDIAVTDFVMQAKRFRVSYNILSLITNFRYIVNVVIGEEIFLNSIIGIYGNSNWCEREIWDTYGIYFLNHVDLRRILTDYGFRGFPFRKDFPLTGYLELRYDDNRGDLVYEPVELAQELRFFNFSTGWEED